ANSRLSASRALAETGGPALAGSLIQWLTPVGATIGDALSYLISAFCLGQVRHREPPPQASPGAFWHELGAGWRMLWGNATMRALTLAAVTRNLGGGAFAALYILYLLRELSISPVVLGLLFSVGGVGGLAGALLAPALARRWRVARLLRWMVLANAICAGLTPVAGATLVPLLPMVAQGCGGITDVLCDIYGARLVAGTISPDALGRVLGTSRLLAQAALPLGALLGALASAHVGLRVVLVGAAVVLILATLWLMRLPDAA
nr:MFS transporter [Ktedonobacterales bacterium]